MRQHATGCGLLLGSALQLLPLRLRFSQQTHIQVRDPEIFSSFPGNFAENESLYLFLFSFFARIQFTQVMRGLRGTRKVAIFMTPSKKIMRPMVA